jgi:hypothetical protein
MVLADELTLSQPGGEDYAHNPGFSDLPTALPWGDLSYTVLTLYVLSFNVQNKTMIGKSLLSGFN